MDADELFMQRCLDLALNGAGEVAPNPMVGCVIVYDHKIIGEGYHKAFGGPHAEVNAIVSVKDRVLLPGARLYVNLEPCSHYGKTPPCTDFIIKSNIRDVVIGCQDPYHEVSGRGISMLRENGCRVVSGILQQESEELNKRFMVFHRKKRPYVILKWAQTADGFIDIDRTPGAKARPTWITSERLRMLVHKWRSEEAGIMVGTNTVIMDNPNLNVRDWTGRQPFRILLDRECRLASSLNIFQGGQPTLVFNAVKDDLSGTTEWKKVEFDAQLLDRILTYLHQKGILSLFIEGGKQLLQSFIDQGLWDEARVFSGSQFFGSGCRAPGIQELQPEKIMIGNECCHYFKNYR